MGLYSNTQLARPGLANYWRLNEASGTTAADSKSAQTGNISAGVTLGQSGSRVKQGDNDTSFLFDGGATTHVDVPNSTELQIPPPISVEGIINPVVLHDYDVPIGKGAIGDVNTWGLFVKADGSLLIGLAASLQSSAPNVIRAGQWQTIAFTYDGSTAYAYVNGVRVLWVPNWTVGSGIVSTHDLQIGGGTLGNSFDGYMQDWSMYNRILSPRELQIDAQIMALAFPERQVDAGLKLNSALLERRQKVNDVNYTTKISDRLVVFTNLTAARTVTLHDPTVCEGQVMTISDESGQAGSHAISFAGTILGTIGPISTNYGTISVYSTGTAWKIR
jgi:hypothetical protein